MLGARETPPIARAIWGYATRPATRSVTAGIRNSLREYLTLLHNTGIIIFRTLTQEKVSPNYIALAESIEAQIQRYLTEDQSARIRREFQTIADLLASFDETRETSPAGRRLQNIERSRQLGRATARLLRALVAVPEPRQGDLTRSANLLVDQMTEDWFTAARDIDPAQEAAQTRATIQRFGEEFWRALQAIRF